MLLSREDILKLNSCFSEHLISVQKAKHEPSNEWTAGDSVILHGSDKATVLTMEQAIVLNKEDRKYFLDNKDTYESQNIYKWIGRATLVSSKTSVQDYFADLGQFLSVLTSELGSLVIMGDWNTPWLSQENDYVPVYEAAQFLGQEIDKTFNGGFVLKGDEIVTFIPHLFWLTRCNASLPEFMMTFERSKTVFNLCKYGVLHTEFYDAEERTSILKTGANMGFREVESCNDPVSFDSLIQE